MVEDAIWNSDCSFQWWIDQIFQGLPYCFVYVDDILISSPDLISHLEHVQRIFDLLQLQGLSINTDRCTFAASTVDYHSMRVSESGCFPLVKHTESIPALQQEVFSSLAPLGFIQRSYLPPSPDIQPSTMKCLLLILPSAISIFS